MRLRPFSEARFGLAVCCLAPVLLVLNSGGAGMAQTADTVASGPQSITSVYGDWTTRCQRAGTADAPLLCEAAQYIHLPDQNQPAAQIILARAKDAWRMTIEVAPNIDLPDGMTIELGTAAGATGLAWRRCLPAACIAEGAPSAAAVETWMAATDAGRFKFKDASGQTIIFPISPLGLRAAVAAFATD